MNTNLTDRIKALATSSSRFDGAWGFTAYHGMVGTAANLKTHKVIVEVWDDRGRGQSVDIRSICGTTARWNASQHTALLPGDAEVSCQRCSNR